MYEIIYLNDDLRLTDTHNSLLSIRFEPNGLYFSLCDHNKLLLCEARVDGGGLVQNLHNVFAELSLLHRQFLNVNILNVTDKFTLVPQELYTPENKLNYFDVETSGHVAEIECGNGVILLMYIDNVIDEAIHSVLGQNNVNYTHPIAQIISNNSATQNTLYIKIYDKISFIVLYVDEKLRLAEAFPVTDFASLLFVVNRAITANKLANVQIVCSDLSLTQQFNEYYPNVLCE